MCRSHRRTRQARRLEEVRSISLSRPPGSSGLRRPLLILLFLFDQLLLLSLFGGVPADFVIAIEVNVAVDENLLHLSVNRKRVLIVNHQVRILADLDGSDAVLDAELLGRIERDQ